MSPVSDDPRAPNSPLPPALERAGAEWTQKARPDRLVLWLERELLGPEGLPRSGAPSSWWNILETLASWRMTRPSEWPARLDQLVGDLLKNALRFSRTDGSPVFAEPGTPAGRAGLVRFWTELLEDPALRTVALWWFPEPSRARRSVPESSPPLPSTASEGRVLAMLRPDWRDRGDFVAVDQPAGISGSRVEVRASGRWLVGPDWPLPVPEALSKSPRRLFWSSLSRADALEWSLRSGSERIVRTALLFRGASMALLAEQRTPVGPRSSVVLPLAPGVSASLRAEGTYFELKTPDLKAQAIPLAPSTDMPGRLSREGTDLVLNAPSPGKRSWAAWLVVWDQARLRRRPVVRPLTVTSRTALCPSDVAQAYRVAWGTGLDSLVVYRSLARPDLRTFLGQQTTASFLAGWFNTSGSLTPLATFPA